MDTRVIQPIDDRGPLRVMFMLTSMPVGGAETLLVNLIRRMDRDRFLPEICCLKELGELGETMSREVPVTHSLINHKLDVAVVGRLRNLFLKNRIDALCTIGAGDKMFWGRIAARWAQLPVVMSAIHSTGWPDGIGRLNRTLTRWTDAFIGCADEHGRHLVDVEKFPTHKVHVIPNGVDTDRFCPNDQQRHAIRSELGIADDDPVCAIVAALRPEKNHELYLRMAARIIAERANSQFVIVGDGPERPMLEQLAADLGIVDNVHFLGTRSDVVDILAATDVFALTSHNEANPVSILEALSVQVPVVASNVGSVSMTVKPGVTGFLAEAGNEQEFADQILQLFNNSDLAHSMGHNGRHEVEAQWSLDRMVRGYQDLICDIYQSKSSPSLPAGVRNDEEITAAVS